MVCAPFEYIKVFSHNEAAHALADHGEDAKLLAGGQSLVPMLNLRLVRPSVLIDINAADSRQPYLDDGCLVLPALTRHVRLIASPVVRASAPMLSAAASHVGNVRDAIEALPGAASRTRTRPGRSPVRRWRSMRASP